MKNRKKVAAVAFAALLILNIAVWSTRTDGMPQSQKHGNDGWAIGCLVLTGFGDHGEAQFTWEPVTKDIPPKAVSLARMDGNGRIVWEDVRTVAEAVQSKP